MKTSLFTMSILILLMTSCAKNTFVLADPASLDIDILSILIDGKFVAFKSDKKPIPIGGETAAYERLYKFLNNNYPEVAKEKDINGIYISQLLIDDKGIVPSTQNIQSLGNQRCDGATYLAIRKFYELGFEPFLYKGKPTRVKYRVAVNFNPK